MSYYRLNLLSVLVVDDDPDICALINDLLRALGFGRCLTAVNGEVAMAILADSEATPIELVITEIAMEPGDGGDLLQWIRRSLKSPNRFMPVVLMTGQTEMEAMLRMRDLGVTEVLAKPLSLDRLCSVIDGLIASPRRFVESGRYFGPDRRRLEIPYRGGERRDLAEEMT
jgi:DNA-binding response OmpR family regulator